MSIISPYSNLEDRAFWRSGVAEVENYPPSDIYRAKFPISKKDQILTAGSCFAQHVGRALLENDFSVIDTEPMPNRCPKDLQHAYCYGLYSARYGNIYSVRQFLQLIQEAYNVRLPAEPVWERAGRYFDALRPSVEPEGYASMEDVCIARQAHLAAVRSAIEKTEVLIFTMGLTEAWEHRESGTVYPTAPGVIANSMDTEKFVFRNFRAREIYDDFVTIRAILRTKSPNMKSLLTVSPVPLTATVTAQHVLAATTYSKSVLRTVCGELFDDFEDVDYFPSYEIVASHPSRGGFFEPNLRSVKPVGVQKVMACFLNAHLSIDVADATAIRKAPIRDVPECSGQQDDLICEDLLLEAFRK